MKKLPKVNFTLLFKFMILLVFIVGILNLLSYLIFGMLITNRQITGLIIYPLEKRACDSWGRNHTFSNYFQNSICATVDAGAPNDIIDAESSPIIFKKPVIYLYPERKTQVDIKINYEPGISTSYPQYQNGWRVIATPQGNIIDLQNGRKYGYLFWEGNPDPDAQFDLTTGFVVKGEETTSFLHNQLLAIGLTPTEANEFIDYWSPKMEHNPYNLIHFATKPEYADRVGLEILPRPDSLLRILMVYKPLAKPISIKPQIIPAFRRHGFSVVEWGGSVLP